MPYIGNTPADKFLTLAKQNFSTSATTSYTLDSAVSSTQDIALFINNVRQSPVDAYTVSGTALTLTSATAGTDEMYCVYLGKTVGTVSPASDSVTTAMLQANAVTGAKLNTDVISGQTSLGATPADTDEFLVSDNGVLKRVDYSYLKSVNTPAFAVYLDTTQNVSNASWTKIQCEVEVFDTNSAYDNSSNYRFTVPSGEAGKYVIGYGTYADDIGDGKNLQAAIYKNGSSTKTEGQVINYASASGAASLTNGTIILNLSAADYVELYGYQNSGGTKNFKYGYAGTSFMYGYKLIGV